MSLNIGERMITRRLFAGGALACLAPSAWGLPAPLPEASRFPLHPSMPVALEHLRAGRWSELVALAASLAPDSASVLLDDLADQSDVDIDLSALGNAPLARTVRGALLVGWAWRYRGSGVAGAVTDEMAQAFMERLVRARGDLQAAIAADSNDGVAYNFLFRTLKGLSAFDALTPTFEAFQSVERKPILAYSALADAVAPKWFGSEAMMLDFARSNQHALEPSSNALIGQVCNEILLDHLRRGGLDAALNFGSQRIVLGEVGAASDAYLAMPTPPDFYQANYANGHFSFYFSFMGLHDHSRPYLQAMAERVTGPWTLFEDDAAAMLERSRTAAGLASI